jgi:O-acetyl-ADP-ribose deacetylase (regulator of RNase III)
VLSLDDYRRLIELDEPFPEPASINADEAPRLFDELAAGLLAESPGAGSALRPQREDLTQRELLRALLTIRPPEPPLSRDFHSGMDRLLGYERRLRGTVEAATLPKIADAFPETGFRGARSCVLLQGDITRLGVDAIVNAANGELLGCFRPFHACIDNAIHSAAGPRLREDCGSIMRTQGHDEPTGHAKATRGYNLPARYVLHTVGPIVNGPLQPGHERALASCYRACLDLTAQLDGVRSVAFCAISTGVFGFPKPPAARIALDAAATWLREHPGALDLIVFNVFGDEDRKVYESALRAGTHE